MTLWINLIFNVSESKSTKMASKNETPVAFLLDGFKWTETRAVLEEFKSLLKCSLCGLVPSSPHNLGRCPHIFCLSCLEEHNGVVCPVPGCLVVHAPSGEKRPNLEREQLTRSVFALGELRLGESVPERFRDKEATGEIDTKKVTPGSKELIKDKNMLNSDPFYVPDTQDIDPPSPVLNLSDTVKVPESPSCSCSQGGDSPVSRL